MKFSRKKKQVTFSSNEIIFKKNNKNQYKYLDTFHNAIWPVLTLAQCFAIMPLIGIRNPNPDFLHFRWKSFRMLLVVIFLLLGSMVALGYFTNLFIIGIDAKNFVGVVFFLCGLSGCVAFIFLAQRWPKLMKDWTEVDLIFLMKPYVKPKRTLSLRVRLVFVILVLSTIFEHGMFLMSRTYYFTKYIQICNSSRYSLTYKDFMVTNFEHVFNVMPFTVPGSIIFLYINWTFTFIWNFLDIFIILISFGLAIRFEQINLQIQKLNSQNIPESVWIELRNDYVKLCELLESVDEHLSAIILLSCLNDLYFICNQLLNIFNKLRFTINYIYFWCSLLYLIARTTCLFLCAASINDQSVMPLKALRSVPPKNWCSEVERFISQITTQCIALSGSKFFFLTRKLLFGMAGTIVTYELVLLQFDAPNRAKELPDFCS